MTNADKVNGVQNFVFDEDNRERAPLKCCSQTTLPRSEVVFICQFGLVFLIVVLSFSMLFLQAKTCEEKSIWIGLISGLVGYVLPNPKL